LIFGPGEHFGLDLARRFAEEGFAIGLIGRNQRALDAHVDALKSMRAQVATALADVTNVPELTHAVDSLAGLLPPIDCAVFNVKSSPHGNATEIDATQFLASLAANVGGALIALQATLRCFAGPRRVFIMTGGGFKDLPNVNKVALSVSKAAMHSLVMSGAIALRDSANVELRTVVINGAVRSSGPLLPDAVAECFWSAYTHPFRRIFRYPSKDKSDCGEQLSLFDPDIVSA
jgi:NAD(P)-dependent dehydrogenase (short-subunit alcohol dehydrogenase family)